MNYSADDRHRSIRDFVALVLGAPPWRVRTERQPVPDDQRPAAVVEETGPATQGRLPARRSSPQGMVDRQGSYTLTAYPVLGETGADARLEAQTIATAIEQAILLGLVDDDGTAWSGPEMIPVFDYAGVPVKGPDRAGPESGYGWLAIEDYPVRAIVDPDDFTRYTVVCEMRVSWQQAGRAAAPGVPVGGMGGTWGGVP